MKCFRLRCYVNNSFLVFHQGTKHSKTIKHSRFALVFHTVFSCLDPLMKHSNSLFTYNIQTRKIIVLLLFDKTITLWFPCLDSLIQTLGNVARVKKSAQNHSPSARVSRAFLSSRNIPACLDQAIQTRKP